MAEEAKIEAPNLMVEKNSTPSRTWHEWVITAPGHRVFSPVSTTLGTAAGFVLGLLCGAALAMVTGKGWLLAAALAAGPFLGAGYAKLVNRLVGTDGLVAKGQAVKIADVQRNQLVISAVKHNAPAYFRAVQRAVELDAIEARLAGKGLATAERAVLADELAAGTEELRLMLSRASLVHAAALLDPSDPAIRAAGHVTAAMYEELQEGKSASYDENS